MQAHLHALLDEAYAVSQLQHNEPGAVAKLREALADPELSKEATAELGRLGAVIKARSVGVRHGDYVSVVLHGLLDKALGEGSR